MAGSVDAIDGRTARAVRTRHAIVEACLALVDDGDWEPTAPRIAARAEVSVRSVFQHFDDLEGLFAAVGDRVLERLAALVVAIDPTLDLDDRIPVIIEQRSVLLEALVPIRKAAFINGWSSAEVGERITRGHALLRREVEVVFARELAAAGDQGVEVLDAIDAVLSTGTWDQLRDTIGLGIDRASAVLERLLRATLAAYRSPA